MLQLLGGIDDQHQRHQHKCYRQKSKSPGMQCGIMDALCSIPCLLIDVFRI